MTGMLDTPPLHRRGVLCAFGAAVLFGVSAPLAKLLVAQASPLALAGLLYLGAGLGLSVFGLLSRRRAEPRDRREAPLRPSDVGLLAGVVVAGGIVGPVLLLTGLARVSGVAASLLLNLEAPFTILLAVLLFGEHLGRRSVAGAVVIALGAAALAAGPGPVRAQAAGVLAIAGACLAWALDNNLTQRLSLRDPVAVARLKGLGAGTATLLLALTLGQRPDATLVPAALLLGAVSYGVSVVLAVTAMRLLGAAREAAIFATAPFAGAVAAVPLLGEPWGVREMLALMAMVVGVLLLLGEHHAHRHTHEEMEHEHAHDHDEHHRHDHEPHAALTEPHSHPHRHPRLTHAHAHVSDAHHRHGH